MALEGPRTRDNEVKPPRGNPGRSLPGKRSSRTRLAGLTARTAAAVAIGAAAVIGLSGLVLARTSTAIRDLERSQYAGMAADARLRLDRLVSRDRDRMMNAAFSDQLYDLLARGAAPPDSFIRPAFTGQFPTQFGDQFIGVYDLSGRRLYAWAEPGQAQLETVAGNALFRILDNREAAVGLIRQGTQLFWVAGAPVLPTNYTAASQPIRGYVVVAQPFNPSLVAPGMNGRPGRIELAALEPAKEAFRTQVGPAASPDSILVNFAFSDIFAQQNTLATITAGRSEFRLLEGRILSVAGLASLAVLLLAVTGYVAARRFLVAPVERLSDLLAPVHSGQTPGLIGSIGTAAEWTTVVQAVNRLVSNSRSFGEHFERLSNVVTEGAWERDLGTGEWTVTARFRELVGYQAGEFPTPTAALAARLEPEDGAPVLAWLEAELPSPRTFTADVRVRRSGTIAWLRFTGEVAAAGPGLPARVIGRIADLAGVHQAAALVTEATHTAAERVLAEGRFLASLAPKLTGDPAASQQLDYIGRGMAGTLESNPAPLDLYTLLQASAGANELSILPGVPDQVLGDRGLLKAALDQLLQSAGAESRITLRADQPDRGRPDLVRIAISDRTPTSPEAIAAIGAILTTGEHRDGEASMTWRALHALATALGGSAGIEGDPAGTRRWIALPLPSIAPAPGSGADLEFQDTAPAAWDSEATPAAASADLVPAPPARPSLRVELVADATVTINLDDTAPAPTLAPVGAQFLANLLAGDPDARRAATAAMAEIPARLASLKGHAKAGEIGAVIDSTETVARVAAIIGADDLAGRCRDVIDAAESQYLDAGDDLILALEAAWGRSAEGLAPHLNFKTPEIRQQPIDDATLEQLTLSLGDGGLGTQLVEHVLAEAPALIEAIEASAELADWPTIKARAADLAGLCGLIGATPLAARCSAAAQAVGSDGWTDALAIRTEWNRVVEVLEGLMGARTGAIT